MAEVSLDNGQQQVICPAPVASCLPNILDFPIVQQQLDRLSAALEGTRSTSEPLGLATLRAHCFDKYPDISQNDVDISYTRKRFFHGGSDPLDFIYIFKNEADPARSISRHWHYVGFGLSDIYDYQHLCAIDMKLRSCDLNYAQNRIPLVQPFPPSVEHVNGFGLELTFRVKCDSDESWSKEPPEWPKSVMQAMARYVYQSKNTFNVGDHLWWQCSLDGKDNSSIEHILLALDPQLGDAQTNLGRVTFIQLVGVCQDELEAARDWTASGVLSIMREQEETGGFLLVTDMQRRKTIFDMRRENRSRVDEGIAEKGSDMTRITARHKTCARKPTWFIETENIQNRDSDMEDDCDLSTDSTHQLPESGTKESTTQNGFRIERGNFDTMVREDTQFNSNSQRAPSRMSYESERALMFENLNLANTRYYDSIYILLNYDTARIFLAVLTNRLAHQRPFTIGSFEGDMATIFVPEGALVHSLVSSEQPYARNGILLQIYVPAELRKRMLETIRPDFCRTDSTTISLPRNYSWPEYKLHITVVDEIKD